MRTSLILLSSLLLKFSVFAGASEGVEETKDTSSEPIVATLTVPLDDFIQDNLASLSLASETLQDRLIAHFIRESSDCGLKDEIFDAIQKRKLDFTSMRSLVASHRNILFWAAANDQDGVVQVLMTQGEYNQTDFNKAMLLAAAHGHINTLRLLIENGANPDAWDYLALFTAVHANQLEVVKFLVEECGSRIHIPMQGLLYYPVRTAIHLGFTDIIDYMLPMYGTEYSDQIRFEDAMTGNNEALVRELMIKDSVSLYANDRRALMNAVKKNAVEVIKIVFEEGGYELTHDDIEAIVETFKAGHLNIVKVFFTQLNGLKLREMREGYLVSLAIDNQHLEIVDFLLSYGFEFDQEVSRVACFRGIIELIEAGFKHTPLTQEVLNGCARAAMGRREVIDFLVERGAHISNERDVFGFNLDFYRTIRYAQSFEEISSIRGVLNDFLNHPNASIDILVHLAKQAVAHGNVYFFELVQQLIPILNPVMARSCSYHISKVAIGSGNLNMVRALVENGAVVPLLNVSLLNNAIALGNPSIVKYLIQNGAKVNAEGRSHPLLVAAAVKNFEIIEALLKAGAAISGTFFQLVLAGAQGNFLQSIFDILPRGDL